MDILLFIIVGLVAGWLAGLLMKGRGFGILGDIVVGILGALIGGLVFEFFGLGGATENLLGSVLVATLGAVILLFIASFFKRSSSTV